MEQVAANVESYFQDTEDLRSRILELKKQAAAHADVDDRFLIQKLERENLELRVKLNKKSNTAELKARIEEIRELLDLIERSL